MSPRPIAAVFACCNHATTLRAVLDALEDTDWPDLRIVAVDCGSTDGSLDLLRARAARTDGRPFHLLELPGTGRATALQRGFDAAGDADVVRLHADVVPDHSGWLRQLVAVLDRNADCGIVGAKITFAGGRIATCGRRIVWGLGIDPEQSDGRHLEWDRDEPSAPQEVDSVGGELCLIRRAVLAATGGLDPGFDPVFGDDDDLCLMARWHGFAVLVEPAVRAIHHSPRFSPTTAFGLPDPDGQMRKLLELREQLLLGHREHWRRKWGFDPQAPDLGEIRRRYGHTRICWRIGERLRSKLPEHPAVDVCLVTWNSMAMLPRMLAMLAATRWHDVRVWITDNGSTDGTLAFLAAQQATYPFPLHVERLGQNVGVAPALNAAFARGTAPLVARLDDDVFLPPDWLEKLVPRFRQRPFAGMVGPKVLNETDGDSLQNGPAREWPGGFEGVAPHDHDRLDGLVRVVSIRGCCNLYRRDVFAEVGLLDPRYAPSQFDEWDHHIALAVHGYEAIYDGSVAVRHLLNAGRSATPSAMSNFRANLSKCTGKWGRNHWRALDRGIDLSIEGRLLPPDGDTAALLTALPPVPSGPPVRPPRDEAVIARQTALARARTALRGDDGPIAPWARQIAALGNDFLDRDLHGRAGTLVTAAMDLLPHDAEALLFLARYRAREGDYPSAIRTVRWALRLRPEAAALREQGEALLLPTRELPRPRRRTGATGPSPARVLILPPFDRADVMAVQAAEAAADALAQAGCAVTVERDLVPTADACDIVHAFGFQTPLTLANRLQAARARAPRARFVLTPQLADPEPPNWIGNLLRGHLHQDVDGLREILALTAAGRVVIGGRQDRRLPVALGDDDLAAERHALAFCDLLLAHSLEERTGLRRRHARLPQVELCCEGRWPERDADDGDVPAGDVIAVGPRELPQHHLPLALALADSGLALTLLGHPAYPWCDALLQRHGGPRVQLRAWRSERTLAALRRHRVFVWLPASTGSFALPMLAADAGCELVLTRGVGAEALFGDDARYVDPCDLPGLRAAIGSAMARQPDPDAPWRRQLRDRTSAAAFGARLLHCYGLGEPAITRPRARTAVRTP